jgi:hypothetical protein
MSATMTAQLVADALIMALRRRGQVEMLLHHSDQAAQYTSAQFRALLKAHGIACSMSKLGDVWEFKPVRASGSNDPADRSTAQNAAMASFLSSLKVERNRGRVYRSRDEALVEMFDDIERVCNPKRRHSPLGYLSPVEFEKRAVQAQLAVHRTGDSSQIDFRSRLVHLNPMGRVQTAKQRPTVPIDERLLEVLRVAYRARTCDYVIECGGAPINSIKRAFREAAARAGFAPRVATSYTLRHTAATWMAQKGVPLRGIAGFLGHADTRTVERTYAHDRPDHMKRAKSALAMQIAKTGAASHPMRAALAQRDPEFLTSARICRKGGPGAGLRGP